jgi:hypothetical protein
MGSPQPGFTVSSDVLDQWRGERLTYSEVGWTGAAVALVTHAALHFFSVAIPALERGLALFGPPERLAFGLTGSATPLGRWLFLIVSVAVWGALIGVGILSAAHEIGDLFRRLRNR